MQTPTSRTFDNVYGHVANWLHHLTYRRTPEKPSRQSAIMVEAPTAESVTGFQRFSKWAGIIAALAGYHVLLGWIFNIDVLRSPSARFAFTHVTSAFCAVICGTALYLLHARWLTDHRLRSRIILSLSALTVLIAVFSILEKAFGWNLGIDYWPLPQTTDSASDFYSPMSLSSGIIYLLIGISLASIDGIKSFQFGEVFALFGVAFSLLSMTLFIYGAEPMSEQMPFYTAVATLLLSAGLLSARPDRGFMAKVTSNSFGGFMARRLLPAALVIPLILGWAQHYGQWSGWYAFDFGNAVFAFADAVVFIAVVWWGVSSLHRMDTKRRQAEEELKSTADKLARSNADLEQFAYVASHDLKEPLRAISGSVQILEQQFRDRLDGDAGEVIKHTVEGATRMQRLIDDLLTYSRLTTREGLLEPMETEAIVDEVKANLESAIRESRAIVTADPLPVVRGDRTQLMQVFQNLIGNGIKYRSQRTPKIHVSAEDRDHEWVFSVRDNGIGIAPQYAERIFRIFQRLHTRSEYSGTGIGLAVCKKIIERHGGRIWVESEPEEGSTFFFTLPKYAKQPGTERLSTDRAIAG